ncbi:MAG: hypothetical protein LBC06_02870 [Rickettsiales bacterium]|jgi:hypothetical protein|nr:hypothetical protein [Rickettsiales bacterium]
MEKKKITNNDLYSLIPNDYTLEEKEEILRVIHEYNAICLEILNSKQVVDMKNKNDL